MVGLPVHIIPEYKRCIRRVSLVVGPNGVGDSEVKENTYFTEKSETDESRTA